MNVVILTGRLTRDCESKMVGELKVTKFGFATSGGRKKNKTTGAWEDDPVFIDCEAFNKTAETAERFLRKGSFCSISGRLKLDQWDDKATGQKRSKHVLVVNEITLGPKGDYSRAELPDVPDLQTDTVTPNRGIPF